MGNSLNELLLSIPLYEMNFITPFPKEEIIYEKIVTTVDTPTFDLKTLLVINNHKEWLKLNDRKLADKLVQQQNLLAIVICNQTNNPLQKDIKVLYKQCKIPIIQVENNKIYEMLTGTNKFKYVYSDLSVELDGFFKRGFMDLATNLAMAFSTPFVFLDENRQLLWQTGPRREINDCMKWLTFSDNADSIENGLLVTETDSPYIQFLINIASKIQLFLITSSNLSMWQKEIIDKFIGFTAVLFQTEEVVREQNDKFKEFFIYELIYRKFESKQVLVNQGKTWGYNLEKPHHLLVVETSQPERFESMNDFLDEIVFNLETNKPSLNRILHTFPFQDHVIILVEDDVKRSVTERRSTAQEISEWVRNQVKELFPRSEVNIGVGKWYFDTIDLNKSYQEAKIAIQFGKLWFTDKQIHHVHDLGVLHLLINIHRDLLDDFCEQYLSPIINSDKKEGTEYMITLKTYFQYHGVISDIADVMFIHPNTLRKRLKKVEELINMDFQNMEDLLTLMVAVKIYYSFSF